MSKSGDEQLLIDFILGRCDESSAEDVRRRLESDGEFALLHEGISRTFSALGLCGSAQTPADLCERTLERVSSSDRAEVLKVVLPSGGVQLRRFSIRELGALAAAAVIVVGILLPSLRQAHRLAQRNLCANNVWAVGSALNHYANGSEGNFPSSPAAAELWLHRPGHKYASNSAVLFLLVRGGCASSEMFQCPSAGGRAFVLSDDMKDFPSPQSINYSYQHSLNASVRRNRGPLAMVAGQMVILADATPVFTGGSFRPERAKRAISENHSDGGQNVLYLDGHVKWATDCRVGVNGDNIWLAEGVSDYTGKEKPASPTDTFLLPHPE
jgi:prepilin-type processing-associated H-X9-DG protein